MQQTSTAKWAAFFQKFKKTVRALRVNETKINWRNVFALEGKRKSKNDEKILLSDYLRILDLVVNP